MMMMINSEMEGI